MREGVVTGSITGSSERYTVVSPLVSQLRMPSASDAPGIGCSAPLLYIGGVFAIIYGAGNLFVVLLGISQLAAFGPKGVTLESILSIAFWLVLIGLPGALGILAIRTARRKTAFAKNEVPGAQAAWDNLYFCSRCDGGFVPAKAEFVPIAKLREYLYRK